MKIGIVVSTYMNEKTDKIRLDIIKKCLDSLLNIDIQVIVMDDGSINTKHIDLIDSYSDKFKIIHRNENGGIAKCKNSAIKFFEDNDFDICFLMDDDVEILDKEFYKYYIEAYEKTGIEHFCLQPQYKSSVEKQINDYTYIESEFLSGCLLMITKNIIKEIGYFKILPIKYGHEHTNYTIRCIKYNFCPGFVDIKNSYQLVKLIDESNIISSIVRPTPDELDQNAKLAFNNIEKYINCIE